MPMNTNESEHVSSLSLRDIPSGEFPSSVEVKHFRTIFQESSKAMMHSTSRQQALIVKTVVILSPRERTVLTLISRGLSNKRIAIALEIAPETVKTHAKHILLKLNAQTRAEAVARAAGIGV